MDVEQLLALEERFWTGGVEFYREELTDDCRMIFPGLGILSREEVIAGISGGRRWAAIEISEPRVTQLADGSVAILAYRATARREGDEHPYNALASSTYVARRGTPKLAFHQQSAAG